MKKAALLVALLSTGAMGAKAASYTGDLLAGFTVANGDDLVYDLGAESTLANGSSWNLSSALTAAGISPTSAALQWGVVGSSQTTPHTEWLTDATAPFAIDAGQYSAINSCVKTLVNNDFTAVGLGNYATPAFSLSYSWYQETAQGANGTSADYSSQYTNPNQAEIGSIAFYSSTSAGVVTNLGTFTLTSSGVLTFNVAASAPPVPRIVSVKRSGSTSTIYFTTANGFTYSLYYTNSAGLLTSVTTWPSSPATLSGNGLTNSLSDNTSVADRFYVIRAH